MFNTIHGMSELTEAFGPEQLLDLIRERRRVMGPDAGSLRAAIDSLLADVRQVKAVWG